MGSFWGLSIQLVMFREQGVLRRFRLAPIGAGAMLASSIVSNYLLTLPTIVAEFLLARWVFHLEHWGNLPTTFVLVSLGTITFASYGLTIASVTSTMQETQMINNAIWTVFIFLSGATFPLPFLPGPVQSLAVFLPPTYLVTGLQRAIVSEAHVWQLGAELLALAGGAAVAFLISWQLFRWEPEEKIPARAKARAAAVIIPFLLLGVWESARGQLRSDAKMDFDAVVKREMPGKATRPAGVP
jgi:ABC-2 type transport system permease protein